MVDALDQSEVDALLEAADSGQLDASAGEAGGAGHGASPQPADATQGSHVRPYDFKRPEKVSAEQRRALETVHEAFARNFGASLSGFVRMPVEVRVARTEQLTYTEFILSLPNPTCFNLLTARPLEGQVILEISPLIIYPIMERLLGGSSSEMFIPQRALTTIEQRLVSRILDRALGKLTEAWANLAEAQFELHSTESNPRLVQIMPPNEIVVVIAFEIKMADQTGTMSLCLPFNVIEPVMGRLVSQGWLGYTRDEGGRKKSRYVAQTVSQATLQLQALLTRTSLTMRDLLALRPGDLVTTTTPANGETVLYVQGEQKFAGQMGQYRGHRAVRITRPLDQADRI